MSKDESLFGYEKLHIWQRGMNLWERLHRITSSFPDDERYGLISQIRRAACSVPANIAEGYGMSTNRAFAAMVVHARGSAFELRTLIEGALRFGYIDSVTAKEILDEIVELSKMINGFLKKLEQNHVKELRTDYRVEADAEDLESIV